MTALEVHNLTVSYDSEPVLREIDLAIPGGSFVGILGPNGSGKTTLLKTIMGIHRADSGSTRIFDKPVDRVRQRISYVPQRQSVDWDFPATVLQIVEMGRYKKGRLFGRLSAIDKAIALEALERVGMLAFKDRQISELSGGQQQRVFLARSISQQADIYFMDEPFAGVDVASEEAIIAILLEMKRAGKTLVVVHHDLHTAPEYFDWMVILNNSLIASGPAKEVFTEENITRAYGGRLTFHSQLAGAGKTGQRAEQERIPKEL